MSARINELRKSNTSGVPGLRLRERLTRTGLRRLWIDVNWHSSKRRGGISYPADRAPVVAVARAMGRRAAETGVAYEIGPRAAWRLIRRMEKQDE